MKLNFWQILGVILVVIGLIFVIRKELGSKSVEPLPAPAQSTPVPTTLPTGA